MQQRIYTAASGKGGVGKSTIAYELAQLTNSVLVDFEWDGAGVSYTWGYNPDTRTRDPLLDALERGRTPRPLTGRGVKPDLVPGSEFLQDIDLAAEEFGERIVGWATEWGRSVVVDTHPGASPAANGAMAESNVIILPTTPDLKDLRGAERMVHAMADYPIIVVPNKIPRVPSKSTIAALERIVEGTQIPIGPPIPHGGVSISQRKKRMALTGDTRPSMKIQPAIEQFRKLAKMVEEYGND